MSIGAPQYKETNTETLTGTTVLTINSAYYQVLDPGGAGREVDMPDGALAGQECHITNSADMSEALTIKQSDSSTTVITIDQNESALLVCNGSGSTTGWQSAGITES